MAVNVKGLKFLNTNCYDSIMIRENGNFQIDVKSAKIEFDELLFFQGLNTKCNTALLSDELNEKTDEEKIIHIIKKYLEYSQIYGITNAYHLSHYNGWFNKISGTRDLYLQIESPILKDIYKLVLKKYIDDRLRFCSINDVNNININVMLNSSYSLQNDVLQLNLMGKESNIVNVEKQFFRDFVSNKLDRIDALAQLKYHRVVFDDDKNNLLSLVYLTCGNLNIKIQSDIELLEILKELVIKHNNDLEQSKKMQLKIKGF